jgi:hypothetical protein
VNEVSDEGRDTTGEGPATDPTPGDNQSLVEAGCSLGPYPAIAKSLTLPAIPAIASLCLSVTRSTRFLCFCGDVAERRCQQRRTTTSNSPPAGPLLCGRGEYDREASRRSSERKARRGATAPRPDPRSDREARREGFSECDSPECSKLAVVTVHHPLLENGALQVCEFHADRAEDLGADREVSR